VSGLPPVSVGAERGEIPYLRSHPGAAQFAKLAWRFSALAEGHALGDFLGFCGRLCAAQAAAALRLPLSPDHGEPPELRPLDASRAPRGEWIAALRAIASELGSVPMPAAARDGLARVVALDPAALTALAGKVLTGDFTGLDLAAAPFVAAALQVEFAGRAEGVAPSAVKRSESGCPLCGSPPVAGIVLGDDKLRYLVCSLCGSQWHCTRVTCSHCGSTAGISYFSLEGDPGGVKAEVCDRCQRYVKLFYLERRPAAEAVADDLATLALDVLVSEQGYARSGVNLYLLS
jgi:FdhE protein